MKLLKRTACIILSLVLCLGCLSACHQKDEVAISFGEGKNKVEITSAMYICNLIQAYENAANKVDQAKQADADDSADSEETTDYLKEKVDGKDFTKYVEDKAMEEIYKYAAVQSYIKENGVEMTDDEKSQVEQYAATYWTGYGYSTVYEKNGVSYDTFEKFMANSNQEYVYFNSLYGEDGEKEVSKKKISANLKKHYVPVNVVSFAKTDSTTGEAVDEKEIATQKKKFQNYADKLEAGEIKFAKVYEAVNGEPQDGQTPDFTSFVGDSETDYAIEDFKKVKKLGVKECIVIEDDYGIYLYQRIKLTDEHYDELKSNIVYNLKFDDFDKELLEIGKALVMNKNNYALKRLKVSNIDLTADQASATQTTETADSHEGHDHE